MYCILYTVHCIDYLQYSHYLQYIAQFAQYTANCIEHTHYTVLTVWFSEHGINSSVCLVYFVYKVKCALCIQCTQCGVHLVHKDRRRKTASVVLTLTDRMAATNSSCLVMGSVWLGPKTSQSFISHLVYSQHLKNHSKYQKKKKLYNTKYSLQVPVSCGSSHYSVWHI